MPCNVLVVVLLLCNEVRTWSQGTIYTDRSVFNSALQSSTTITFETLNQATNGPIGLSPITVGPGPIPVLSVTNLEHRLFICSPTGTWHPIAGDGQYIWNFDSSYPIGVFWSGTRNAFGADFSGGIVQNNPFNASITVNLADGSTFTHNFTGNLGSWTFRGFVFPQTISSIIYSDGGPFLPGAHEEMIDNVTLGNAVPEPKVIVISLCAALAFFRRRVFAK